MTIRVFLVDDHWEVRERLRILLTQEPDFEFIGEAADGAEAVDMLNSCPPTWWSWTSTFRGSTVSRPQNRSWPIGPTKVVIV